MDQVLSSCVRWVSSFPSSSLSVDADPPSRRLLLLSPLLSPCIEALAAADLTEPPSADLLLARLTGPASLAEAAVAAQLLLLLLGRGSLEDGERLIGLVADAMEAWDGHVLLLEAVAAVAVLSGEKCSCSGAQLYSRVAQIRRSELEERDKIAKVALYADVVSRILVMLEEKDCVWQFDGILEEFRELVVEQFNAVLSGKMSEGNEGIAMLLSRVVPLIQRLSSPGEFSAFIWQRLREWNDEFGVRRDQRCLTLSLALVGRCFDQLVVDKAFFEEDSSGNSAHSRFLDLILAGLSLEMNHSTGLIRKQAITLLKKYQEMLNNTARPIDSPFDAQGWKQFLVILRALEEFALHLVEAVWTQFNSFMSTYASARTVSWFHVLLIGALRNSNPAVRKYSLEWLVNLNFEDANVCLLINYNFILKDFESIICSPGWLSSIPGLQAIHLEEILYLLYKNLLESSQHSLSELQKLTSCLLKNLAQSEFRPAVALAQMKALSEFGRTLDSTKKNSILQPQDLQNLQKLMQVNLQSCDPYLRISGRVYCMRIAIHLFDQTACSMVDLLQTLRCFPREMLLPCSAKNSISMFKEVSSAFPSPFLMQLKDIWGSLDPDLVEIWAILIIFIENVDESDNLFLTPFKHARNINILFRVLKLWLDNLSESQAPFLWSTIKSPDVFDWIAVREYVSHSPISLEADLLLLKTLSEYHLDASLLLGELFQSVKRDLMMSQSHSIIEDHFILEKLYVFSCNHDFQGLDLDAHLIEYLMSLKLCDKSLPESRQRLELYRWKSLSLLSKKLRSLSVEDNSTYEDLIHLICSNAVDALETSTSEIVYHVISCIESLLPAYCMRNGEVLQAKYASVSLPLLFILKEYCSTNTAICHDIIRTIFHPELYFLESIHHPKCDDSKSFTMRTAMDHIVELGQRNVKVTESLISVLIPLWISDLSIANIYVDEIASLSYYVKPEASLLEEHTHLVFEEMMEGKSLNFPLPTYRTVGKQLMLTFFDETRRTKSAASTTFLVAVSESLVSQLASITELPLISFTDSLEFVRVYYGLQSLALLTTLDLSIDWENSISNFLTSELEKGISPQLRQLFEMVSVEFFSSHVSTFERFVSFLMEKDSSYLSSRRPSVLLSLLIIMSFTILKLVDRNRLVLLSKSILESVLMQIAYHNSNNTGFIRTTCQYLFFKLYQRCSTFTGDQMLGLFFRRLSQDKTIQSLLRKMELSFSPFFELNVSTMESLSKLNRNYHGLFTNPLIDQLRTLSADFISNLRSQFDDYRGDCHTESREETLKHLARAYANFQEKIAPIQDLYSLAFSFENSNLRELVESRDSLSRKRQSLVVFASFVEKIPNLGGLARTCEIFQASKLVVNDLSVVKNKQFQALSVTAEQWIPMEQVPCGDLRVVRDFLDLQRRQGYSIIALEQTGSSISLEKACFPSKSVLILGKEKEGVPVEVLDMVDFCVEIPQLGLVRSLNVHVSAALCIWEYSKQQMG